ncbi:MAG: serine--tRNA ligase, partial [Candidatus Binatia bacterium]
MLDVKLLRENLDEVKARMATRGTEIHWDEFVSLDRERRDALANIERYKEKKNRLSGEIGRLKKSGADAAALMSEVEEVSEAIRNGEKPLADIEARFEAFMLSLPNLPNPSVTLGSTAEDNKEVRRWGEPPTFDFEPKNHWDIGE